MIISVVSGGSVMGARQFGAAAHGVSRIKAVAGARYSLAEQLGGNAPAGVIVKRIGKDLVIGQTSDGAEEATFIIEDFYGSNGQLVSQGDDGQYLSYLAVSESGAVDAADLSDGDSSLLALLASQATSTASTFQFSEGDSSSLGGALTSAAAIAGGIALSTGGSKGGGSKPQAAPAASALALDGQEAVAAPNAAIPAAGETTLSTAVLEPAVVVDRDSGAAMEAEDEAGLATLDGAIAPFAAEDIPVIEKAMDDHGLIQGVIENGGYTDDVYPTLMGRADPGVKVHVYRGKFLQGYTVADANGEWSYTPSSAYASGTHSMTVKYEYPNKDTSGYSEPYIITVDKIAPGIPQITGILDDEGRITGAITDQTITDDNRPTISGTAEANATLIVYDKGKEIGSTTVGADGTWSFTPDTPLADGLHMLSCSAVDRAGNSGEQTEVTEFIVDTRPEKVNIYLADDNAGVIQGEMFNGSVTDDNTPTLMGTATAGGIVSIYEGSVLLGQVTVDVDGTWQFTPPAALSDGAHIFHATVTLVAKGESERSKSFNLMVDTAPPEKPSIDAIEDNEGSVQGLLSRGEITDDNTPTLIGRAEPGSTVTIHSGGLALGNVVADGAGNWRFTPGASLDDGTYSFTVTAADTAGNVSAPSVPFEISIDTLARVKPTIDSVVDDVGALTGAIGNGGVTDDANPQINGRAEAGSTVIIKDDGVEIGRTQANAAGDWSFVPSKDLADGTHTLTVEAVDGGGHVSEPSEPFGFTVDTYLPTAIVTQVGRDSGFDSGDFLTNDGSAGRVIKGVLSDALKSGQRVEVSTDGGKSWANALVQPNGGWRFVDFNTHTASWEVLTRVASDIGLTGEASSQRVNMDVTAPTAPTAIAISGNSAMVSFESAAVTAGDRIYLNQGTSYFEYRLTAADVLAGKAMITPGFQVSDVTAAALIDQAGNISKFRACPQQVTIEDFSSATEKTYGVGQTLVLDTMSVKVLRGQTSIRTYEDLYPQFGNGKRLSIGYSGKSGDRLEISFDGASKVSFTTDFLHDPATYDFYDVYGNHLATQSFDKAPTGYAVSYTANPGVQIGSIVAYTTEWGFLDNFEFTRAGVSTLFDGAQTKYVNQANFSYQGGARDDIFVVSDIAAISSSSVHGNGGIDTLRLNTLGKVLDMKALGDRIASIEVIDLTQGAYNLLKLSLGELLENGAVNGFVTDGYVQMKVMGNTGDTVELGDALDGVSLGGWGKLGQMTLGGALYDVYRHSGVKAEIFVKAGVKVTAGLGMGVTIEAMGSHNAVAGLEVTDGAAGQLVSGKLSGAISPMEIIDLAGNGNNVLTLNLSDVLRNGGIDLFHTGDKSRVQMMVTGNAGDSVKLSDLLTGGVDHGDWVQTEVLVIDGVNYNTYQHSSLDAEVLVKEALTVVVANSKVVGAGIPIAGDTDIAVTGQVLAQAGEDLFAQDAMLTSGAVSVTPNGTAHHTQGFGADPLELHHVRLEAY